MKRKSVMLLAILLIAGALVSAITYQTMQNPDNGNWKGYEKEWAIVDSLEGQGLPASALKAAEAIYVYAKTDKNDEQIVKAIIHKAKYTSMVEENEHIKRDEQSYHIISNYVKNNPVKWTIAKYNKKSNTHTSYT